MKKLLSILGAVGLTATASTAVVSCAGDPIHHTLNPNFDWTKGSQVMSVSLKGKTELSSIKPFMNDTLSATSGTTGTSADVLQPINDGVFTINFNTKADAEKVANAKETDNVNVDLAITLDMDALRTSGLKWKDKTLEEYTTDASIQGLAFQLMSSDQKTQYGTEMYADLWQESSISFVNPYSGTTWDAWKASQDSNKGDSSKATPTVSEDGKTLTIGLAGYNALDVTTKDDKTGKETTAKTGLGWSAGRAIVDGYKVQNVSLNWGDNKDITSNNSTAPNLVIKLNKALDKKDGKYVIPEIAYQVTDKTQMIHTGTADKTMNPGYVVSASVAQYAFSNVENYLK